MIRCMDLDKLVPELKALVLEIVNILHEDGFPFEVFETWRSKERQQFVYDHGMSKTLHSKHCVGKACDIVLKNNGKWTWDNPKAYAYLGKIVDQYPQLVWGGHFPHIVDMCHVELK